MALTHILEPIDLGPTRIRNRVVRTAHGTRLANYSFRDLTAFHAARARGGVGLSILEILGVHSSSPTSLNAFDPAHADGYRSMVSELRPLGMKVFQQIWHGGHHVLPADGGAPWSASDVPSPAIGVVPIAMTQRMIDEIVQAYADTAAKCEAWGLDGVEVHCAHGYLPQQFLSPNTNHRGDTYGGSFENRARFIMEVMAAVRGAVSAGFTVGIRVAPDDVAHGVGVAENIRLVQRIEEAGLADYVNISLGSYQSFSQMLAGMWKPTGYELPTSIPIARATRLPTLVTGRFRTLEEADQVIRCGEADMVALTRAHIADPDLVRKTMEGRAEQIRPCIACNQGCLAGVLGPSMRISCTINAAAGFEWSLGEDKLQRVAQPRRILVIGGGPAGMEAARVAALRGHQVVLVEASPQLGGALLLAAKAPSRAGIKDIVVWLEAEVFRLGVEVRLSSYFDVSDALAEQADVVIVATGSLPRMDGQQVSNPGELITGMHHAHVLSSHDLLECSLPPQGRRAVVMDDAGHYEGIASCEYLAALGFEVDYVSRHISFAPLMETSATPEPALQRLTSTAFRMHLRSRALSITPEVVTIAPTFLPATTAHTVRIPADLVVVISHNRPNRDLVEALREKGCDVRVIGDAQSPRFLPTAIKEGFRTGIAV